MTLMPSGKGRLIFPYFHSSHYWKLISLLLFLNIGEEYGAPVDSSLPVKEKTDVGPSDLGEEPLGNLEVGGYLNSESTEDLGTRPEDYQTFTPFQKL